MTSSPCGMVQMVDPKPRERIGDLAGGTGGFLVNAHQHILEKHTSRGILEYDAEGLPYHLIGDQYQEPMLTDPKLRSQVDALWDKFWTGGLAIAGCDWAAEQERKNDLRVG